VNRFISERCSCKYTLIVIHDFVKYCIHDALRIQHTQAVSAAVSDNTIIVIHQVDMQAVDMESLRSYVVSTATDGYNSNKFCILMCLSSAETFLQVADYNSGEKLSVLCYPSEMRWSDSQLESVIGSCFPNWSVAGKKKLLELTRRAMSPGLIVRLQITGFKEANLSSPVGDIISELTSNVEKRAGDWSKFEDAEKKLKTGGTFHNRMSG
jgi:hypothetical protein